MPELPEVESVRLKLGPQVEKKTILHATLRRKDLRIPFPKNFSSLITNQKILSLRRRSKYLLFDLSNQQTMIVHLGMSGRLFLADQNRELDKHDHVLWDLSDNMHLRFRDPRRFGLVTLCETDKINQHAFFEKLGPEPLEKDFNSKVLFDEIKTSASPIKTLIMDAHRVVGVGNIYASEALFLAKIHPERLGKSITEAEANLLAKAIKDVLKKSITSGGTSFRDYVGPNEEPGLYKMKLNVYGRAGEPCSICQSPIQMIRQQNRASYFCGKCQR